MYLTGYTKARLLGIAHETYVTECNVKGNEYYGICETMYSYELIKHPTLDEYALKIEDETYLPSVFISRLVDFGTMSTNGWFAEQEV